MSSCQALSFSSVYDEFYIKILHYLKRLVGEFEAEELNQTVFELITSIMNYRTTSAYLLSSALKRNQQSKIISTAQSSIRSVMDPVNPWIYRRGPFLPDHPSGKLLQDKDRAYSVTLLSGRAYDIRPGLTYTLAGMVCDNASKMGFIKNVQG